jgi:hypothetical protein
MRLVVEEPLPFPANRCEFLKEQSRDTGGRITEKVLHIGGAVRQCQQSQRSRLEREGLVQCGPLSGDLSGANLSGVNLVAANLIEADLLGPNLKGQFLPGDPFPGTPGLGGLGEGKPVGAKARRNRFLRE